MESAHQVLRLELANSHTGFYRRILYLTPLSFIFVHFAVNIQDTVHPSITAVSEKLRARSQKPFLPTGEETSPVARYLSHQDNYPMVSLIRLERSTLQN